MALDGIYLYNLLENLKPTLINAKIDKINQPEKDEVILTIRQNRKNIKLLLSASSKYPRLQLTDIPKANPLQAPMFAMVLRKYLLGGKITNLRQLDGDRLVIIDIESSDEMGFNSLYHLIIEIMGRHSNISLIRSRDMKVMESIKHITPNINSFRVLYPGVTYVYPPKSKKLNPFNFTFDELNEYVIENNIEYNNNFFNSVFTGVSKLLSTGLFNTFKCDYSLKNMFDEFNIFMENMSNSINFSIIKKDTFIKDFYCFQFSERDNTTFVHYDNPNKMMDDFYAEKDKQDRLVSRSISLSRLINNNIDRCVKKESKFSNTLHECNIKESFKLKGDLLTSFIYSIKKGDNSIEINNFFSEDNELIKIELDPNKTPSENIQFYYKKYNKLKKSEESAKIQIEKNKEELDYLMTVITNLENCESYSEIDDIKNELMETGYLRFKNKSKKNNLKNSKPLKFTSKSGIDIFVGKNNLQNDYLSLKFANKNYMWLHAKGIPGSHVIVCSTDPDDSTLEEAAILAAYYSKGKNSTKVAVDYTEVKNLKKPNGSKPGMVIYHTNYSMYVDPNSYNKSI